ncbi:GIY-YIG nuclease family protein [Verrucomicrobia bacterium]|nr:GIY-YIG nuclease family protein [Verrucomicrobiota bacterium]
MFFVYRIHSLKYPNRNYVGYSTYPKQRISDHNAGKNRFTAPFRPWRLVFYAVFETEESAPDFERYLKTASGKAFGSKRLW